MLLLRFGPVRLGDSWAKKPAGTPTTRAALYAWAYGHAPCGTRESEAGGGARDFGTIFDYFWTVFDDCLRRERTSKGRGKLA